MHGPFHHVTQNEKDMCPTCHEQGKAEAIERVAKIDAMFESATGWGSWMVECANEREDLATKFGLPQKYQARCGGRRTD